VASFTSQQVSQIQKAIMQRQLKNGRKILIKRFKNMEQQTDNQVEQQEVWTDLIMIASNTQ
jgi:hypothetical protein